MEGFTDSRMERHLALYAFLHLCVDLYCVDFCSYVWIGHVWSCVVMYGHVWLCKVMFDNVGSCKVIWSSMAMHGHILSSMVMCGQVYLCMVWSCMFVDGHV